MPRPSAIPAAIDRMMRPERLTLGHISKHPKKAIWAYNFVNADGMVWNRRGS